MKRKSKGQKAREEKVTQREQKAIDSMLNDKWFMGLPSLVQLRLVSFMKDKVDLHLGVYMQLGYEKGMIHCMACVMQVLMADYWKKAPKKKWAKFINDVIALMDSYERDVVSFEEMRDYIYEHSGIEIKMQELGQDKRPTPRDLFKEG